MASQRSVLVFGVTGFIGGDLLAALLSDAETGTQYKYGALTSSKGKQSEISNWAAKSYPKAEVEVHVAERSNGGKSFYDAAEKLSAQYDLVIQAATSDDLELTKAINRGIEAGRKDGKLGLLLHFSGVQLIESEPIGKYAETPIYDDSDNAMIAGIADSAAHRLIDLEIEHARQQDKIARASAIVCPALVWGKGRGPTSPYSAQVPDMVTKALRNGQPVVVGEGTNEWTNVNVQEMNRFLVELVKRQLNGEYEKQILKGDKAQEWETFYFAVSPHFHTFGQIADAIGAALPASAFKHGTATKSLPVPPFDKSQKGVRIEDASRESGEQARIERFTPFWPDRTNNRAVAKRANAIPGGPWFTTEYREQQMHEDVRHIYECMQKAGNLPQCEV